MVVDHIGLFWHIPILQHVGRPVFPIFSFLIAYNYLHNTKNKARYVRRLFLWALVAEPVYRLGALNRPDIFESDLWIPLNVLFTLALGLLLLYCIEQKKAYTGVVFALILPVAFLAMYWIPGVFLIPAIYFAISKGFNYKSSIFLIAVLATINPPSLAFATILSIPIVLLVGKATIDLPRGPGWFFYAFYPIHFTLFSLLSSVAK